MEDSIYSNRKGEDININYNKGFYYYLRLFYVAHGNTQECRVILKNVKYLIDKQEKQLIINMFNRVDFLYKECGNKKYNELMAAIEQNINRLTPKGKELFKPHHTRMTNRVGELTM